MKRILFVAALLLVAGPAFAQVGAQPGGIAGSQLRPNSGAAAFTTFDPSNDLWHVTLSGGNLTATNATCTAGTGFAFCGARGTSPTTHASPDKVFYECTLASAAANHILCGFQSSSYNPASAFSTIGYDSNSYSMGYDSVAGSGFIGGSAFGSGWVSACIGGTTQIVQFAVDFGAQLIWARCLQAGSVFSNWNNSGTANPATGTGGNSFSAIAGIATYYIAMGGNTTGDSVTINVGATAFTLGTTPPAGFLAWH